MHLTCAIRLAISFYPRVTIGYAMCSYIVVNVCLYVCLFITRRYCIETAARIELFFWIRYTGFNRPTLHCVLWIGSPKYGYLFLWNLFQFGHGIPTVGKCDINSDNVRLLITAPPGGWRARQAWQVRSTVNDGRRLLIALDVRLYVLRDGRLGVSEAASRGSRGHGAFRR